MVAVHVLSYDLVPGFIIVINDIPDDFVGDRKMLNWLSKQLQPVAIIK
jgi:hypothetical protein